MEKGGRKVLHERSNSRKNVDVQSLGRPSTDGQISEKDYQGFLSVPPRDLPTPTKGKNVAMPRTPSRTPSTPRSTANSWVSLGSIGSLPPVPPLRINKITPLFIKKQKKTAPPPLPPRPKDIEKLFYPPAQQERPSTSVESATRTASNTSNDTINSLVGSRPLPNPEKPVLEQSPGLGPDTVQDYEDKRTLWREHNQNQAHVYARMSRRSLRIVRNDGDRVEDKVQESPIQQSPQTSPTPLLQSFPTLRPVLIPIPPEPVSIPGSPSKRPPSNHRRNSLLRGNSFLRPSSSKGIPAWARYFYSRGENLVEMPEDEEVGRIGPFHQNGPLSASDSLVIRPLMPAHLAPAMPQPPRISREDSETITQWSYPHLDRTSYPISPTEDVKNRHIVMFCLGFLLPFCWLIGAFLPLPSPEPQWVNGRKSATGEQYGTLENCSIQHLRKYRNSQYWRRVNRFLAPVGLVLMAAIIALGIVASRIR